jgi:hypothetical protein
MELVRVSMELLSRLQLSREQQSLSKIHAYMFVIPKNGGLISRSPRTCRHCRKSYSSADSLLMHGSNALEWKICISFFSRESSHLLMLWKLGLPFTLQAREREAVPKKTHLNTIGMIVTGALYRCAAFRPRRRHESSSR